MIDSSGELSVELIILIGKVVHCIFELVGIN
jgi:hypothetical protein